MSQPQNRQDRFPVIDLLRGLAIVMMFSYHLAWDLNNFGYINTDFYRNAFWLNYRTVIVTTFLLVMGASLYLAHHHSIAIRSLKRRLILLLACSLLITISTRFANGERFIYFGILHFITLASILALPFVRLYWLNLFFGTGMIVAGNLLQHSLFNPAILNWIGFVTRKPLTDDYVPLFPWLGVVLLGIFFARLLFHERPVAFLSLWNSHAPPSQLLQLAGRHSLLIYMTHQPLFIGSLILISQLFPSSK